MTAPAGRAEWARPRPATLLYVALTLVMMAPLSMHPATHVVNTTPDTQLFI